jgi:predicted MPP superfamily phosphohydrolase
LQIGSPYHFEWSRLDLPIANLHPRLAGLRLLHLSDLHMRSRWHRAYDDLLHRIAADPPDLILISGDIFEAKYHQSPTLPVVQRFLTGLRSRLGCFCILGNHDRDLVASRLGAWGCMVIGDRIVTLRDKDAAVELVGGPGVQRQDVLTSRVSELEPPGPGVVRIVLSHFPDLTPQLANSMHPHLVLTGHTHGGQICLPGGWPVVQHDRLGIRMAQGLHRIGPAWMLISRGFGFAQLRIRTFCPAQAVQVVLQPE